MKDIQLATQGLPEGKKEERGKNNGKEKAATTKTIICTA